jgi:hypothetical protein
MREEKERRRLASKISPKLTAAGAPIVTPGLVPLSSVAPEARDPPPSRRMDSTPSTPTWQPGLVGSCYSRFRADFEALGKLGKGGFGEVVKAQNKLDGVVYAIKVIKASGVDLSCTG